MRASIWKTKFDRRLTPSFIALFVPPRRIRPTEPREHIAQRYECAISHRPEKSVDGDHYPRRL